ncbi:DUF3095 domain-containing protein [Aliifodinibius sp. S!AR15-10]|uniref:DUF3095 domain-containing protein n=1 Tax=Aliifodinibius sp. S!AR15-10 TaxID=2950437 RepID=UPI0028611A27|nr:DUF3095 domain-containing protein [Aliifodinibius sp. S!AR15-10]MDR8392382.1 DUF3095 domain-containing protein [Aliifodinibius sp. S!AR15-10]
MSSENCSTFFTDLPLLESFFEISNPNNFYPIPDDWYIAITDIVDSTGAIDQGKYKMVNILGASPIVGMLNLGNKDEIPYTFGGDGCTLCIPPSLVTETRKVFRASREIGKAEYDLDLRAAIIPVNHIREAGFDVKVARYKVSDAYNQSIFSGDGLTYAEEILKDPANKQFMINFTEEAENADFTGLECRWQEVGRQDKKVITMLVRSNPQRTDSDEIYTTVLNKMRDIFSFDDKTNPIETSQLRMNMSISSLMGEIKFRTFGMSWLQRLTYILKMEIQIVLGKIFMALGYKSSATNWSLYKPDLALNSDHRKFDDMLRVVISGTDEQLNELKAFLEKEFQASRLAYGLHVTHSAMITCMVFKYHRQHVHFVDGSDGGYVMAAKKLKERLRKIRE